MIRANTHTHTTKRTHTQRGRYTQTVSHDKFSGRSQEFNLLRLRVAFLQYFIDFTQLKLKIKTIYAKLLRNSLGVITFYTPPPPTTMDSPPPRRRSLATKRTRAFFFTVFLPLPLCLVSSLLASSASSSSCSRIRFDFRFCPSVYLSPYRCSTRDFSTRLYSTSRNN